MLGLLELVLLAGLKLRLLQVGLKLRRAEILPW
jgi:hypothetical protein